MKTSYMRVRIAWLLLIVMLLPILAACGGGETGGDTAAPSPAAETSPATTEGGAASPEAGESPEVEASPSPEAQAPETPAGDDVPAEASQFLVYGNSGEPDNLDSMSTTSGNSLVVTQQIEEPLVGRAEAGVEGLAPLLATEWAPNDDFTEWTFTLREGVEFHDGTPFNAEAVVFNFRRLMEEDFEFGFRDEGKTYPVVTSIFGGYAGDPASSWGGIEAVDEHTVRFTMTRPVPQLPEILSASYFGISSPEAVKEAGAQYGTPGGGAVGTGAFEFESWSPGQNIVLTRNDNYWGEPARMPGAVVRFIADAPARLAELQAGAIDFATNIGVEARTTLENDQNLKEVDVEPFNVAYIAMNLNTEPFTDPLVRQAVAHAIDKDEILQAFYGGEGEVATTFLPAAMSEYRPDDLETYDYDPERARELLAEAGYPDGFDAEFWYMPVSRPYYPTPQPIAEAFAAQLSDVGINVNLRTEDWGVYLDNVDAGKKQGMWMLGWTGDYADPNNFLYTFFGPEAKTSQGYRNEEVINLLEEAGTQAPEEAVETFQEAQRLIAQDVPRIPIVHSPPVYGARQGLEGWEPSRYGSEPWKTMFIEK
jgi:peptide/nickel transport system substrate-binding protein